ncbi:Lsr2 family protein [Nocardioides baekrokdamisoli]|uniref:Lsr2 family protein n=1 Tax=Nocardioides baekrokdamisoli TaxID=1804624 RepID=A0A3G9J452_9ACTN|nr:Lsr2 family protein [Nocardioides baekrokdamisoli]BBH17799.1 Lsr2 family protein [Nocardioides baekrokdamisoli]
MAQRVSIELVDDLDGSAADETVSFALDGTSYELDLSAANAAALREALAGYVGHARRVSSSSTRRTSSSRRPTGSSDARAIREWARANGHKVPERGRVSSEVKAAYEAAQR